MVDIRLNVVPFTSGVSVKCYLKHLGAFYKYTYLSGAAAGKIQLPKTIVSRDLSQDFKPNLHANVSVDRKPLDGQDKLQVNLCNGMMPG